VVPESVVQNNRLFNKINLGYTRFQACDHPNIIKYLRFGRYGKRGYLAMERLRGASLRVALDDAVALPLDEAKAIVRGIGEALQLLHSQELVHGNLTAENVFITESLEVRLLDVLPIDPDESIVGGAAMGDRFSRYTAVDDVFGLACLAYEMLAGQHPFDFRLQAQARLAGLEAERITSLPGSEWNALSAALTFDREQRTPSVADFIRDFGIRGTEQLRSNLSQLARHESIVYPEEKETQLVTKPLDAVRVTTTKTPVATTTPVVAVDPISTDEYTPPAAKKIRKNASPRRAAFLGVALAALGAWLYVGQPQEQVENLIGYLDRDLNLPITARTAGPASTPLADRVEPVAIETAEPDDIPVAAEPAATDDANLSVSIAPGSAPDPNGANDETVAALVEPADEVEPVDLSTIDETAINDDADANLAANELVPDGEATPSQVQAEAGFANSVIIVGERDIAARIELLNVENATNPLVWWTREHSAIADSDFIPVNEQAVADVSTDEGSILHVPLVNDSLPELRESFFVNLGARDPRQGQIERIATVRVDIIDDD
ncbi:MAG: protein kinase, partial [Woeseiaceae bacterium]|nr:protein kinase [Woeseiaceae bacterium]